MKVKHETRCIWCGRCVSRMLFHGTDDGTDCRCEWRKRLRDEVKHNPDLVFVSNSAVVPVGVMVVIDEQEDT